ncbi:MAG TPA: hypothetical protein VFI42_16220 [Thermomicrobiaceae bacterium]|nr:hypothetical protein [Thermomicrobiaceae bacterium]
MATMRMRFQRVELSWIALLLSGMLVGAMLVVGITHLSQAQPRVSVPVVAAPQTQVSETVGGRLGGIASADTANDSFVRQGLAPAVPAPVAGVPHRKFVEQNEMPEAPEPPIGGRLGGLTQADTPTVLAGANSSR